MKDDFNFHTVTTLEIPNFYEKSKVFLKQGLQRLFAYDIDTNKDWLVLYQGLYQLYPEYQYALVESATQQIIALGNCIPLAWKENLEQLPDGGATWAATQMFADDHSQGYQPNILCALNISVLPEYRGRQISSFMLQQMKKIAQANKLSSLIVPARPTLKHLYPLTPMERYITWENENGLPFDPWLRTHVRHGANLVGICSRSATIIDTISNWEARVNMRFPETGDYVIPEGLLPLKIDSTNNQGTYIEPNVWMHYNLV
ncbi:GNAT family N-acetyltransferase [Nostoc sp. UIC 10890]